MQQIGLSAIAIPAGLAQGAVQRDREQEHNADRGKDVVRAVLIEPVRVDLREYRRKTRLGHVMIDNDDVETGLGRGGKRFMRGGAAIDGDDDGRAVGFEAQQCRRVRAIPFAHPVGDIKRGRRADCRKETQQQRGGGRAVDIVITEHDDRLALLHGTK